MCMHVCYDYERVSAPKHVKFHFKGRSAQRLHIVQGVQLHMPIAVEFVSTRRKKIAVDVVPAEWQLYIAQ